MMIKHFFLASAIFFTMPLGAQTFVQEKPVVPPFVAGGAVLVDVDNDQDEDLFFTGYDQHLQPASELHLNDGFGNFSRKAGMPFLGLAEGAVAFADVDGDQDQDLLITGLDSTYEKGHTKLYFNDGNGNFTEASGTNFIAVVYSMIAFGDVDGDNDQDVLIAGYKDLTYVAVLYTNDGAGGFTEMPNTPFIGLGWGKIIFSDIDGDQDQDVFIQGSNGFSSRIAYYINDGTGQFVPGTNAAINNLKAFDFELADYDGDQDQDLLVSHTFNHNTSQFKIFANDGAGNFSQLSHNVPECPYNRYLAVTDIDADGDPDCFFTETDFDLQSIGKLFLNEGSGNFTELPGTPFTAIGSTPTLFADVDKNGRQDILSFGRSANYTPTGKLFLQTGNLIFEKPRGPHFPQVASEVVVFADIDGDQDQDLLMAGDNNMLSRTGLFTNDGTGQFDEVPGSGSLIVGTGGNATFFDADGDLDLDLVAFSRFGSKVYRNNGTGMFSEVPGSNLDTLSWVVLGVSDVDGDQDIDILVSGLKGNIIYTILYCNNGNGIFTRDTSEPFAHLGLGALAFADIDGDLDQDVVIAGTSTMGRTAKLYRNDGAGGFSEDFNHPFEGVVAGSLSFADVDGDNDQDLLITGMGSLTFMIANLYINDGAGNFSKIVPSPFHAARESAAAFSDVDLDGDQDVLIIGFNDEGQRSAILYTNDGTGNFTEVNNMPFIPVTGGTLSFSDIDGDQYPDVYITGIASPFRPTAILYRNTTLTNAQDSAVVDDTPAFRIYPNPAVGEHFTVELDVEAPTSVLISLFNFSGKVLLESGTSVLAGKQTLEFHYPSALAPGLYWIHITAGGRSAVSQVVIP